MKKTIMKKDIFKDPEWWTSISVNIIRLDFYGLAKDLSKVFNKLSPDLNDNLIDLYIDTFNSLAKDLNLERLHRKEMNKNYNFDNFDPHFPTWHEIFDDICNTIKVKISRNELELSSAQQNNLNLLPQLFGEYFNKTRKIEKYSKVNELIDLLTTDFISGDGELILHINNILNLVGKEPLPVDNKLTLWDIFITPKAIYYDDKVKERIEIENQEYRETGKVSKKQNSVIYEGKEYIGASLSPNIISSILSVIKSSSSPIIIHGHPGHGKTSTVRMLTHAIISQELQSHAVPRAIILMYEFKDLSRLDNSMLQILRRITPFVSNEEYFKNKNTIMILDGVDERQITEGSDIYLKDFIRSLFNFSERINKHPNTRFNLIITGRSQFVGLIKSSFINDYHEYKIVDFDTDQINKWLAKYCIAKKLNTQLNYSDFSDQHLSGLIHQPILLTISSLMLTDKVGKDLIISLDKNRITRSKIYQTIIKWSYLKQWQFQPNRSNLPSENTYNKFLRLTAFILFFIGEEHIKLSTLIEHLRKLMKIYPIEGLQNKSDESIENTCKTIAVLFFFEGLSENAFSFIHKSIKDYLVVEALLDLLLNSIQIFNNNRIDRSCDLIAEDIYLILGKQPLSSEDHITFLSEIIADRKNEFHLLYFVLYHFFLKCKNHIYLTTNENNMNENPLVTEANLLSSIYYLITNLFLQFDDKDKNTIGLGLKLNILNDKNDILRFQHLMNSIDPDRCHKHHFNYLPLDLSSASLHEIKTM